jgi:hypothetical protein
VRWEVARDELSVAAVVGAAVAGGNGVVPVSLGGGEQVSEHRWRAGKLVGGSVRAEGGRRRELHGELGGGGGHGVRWPLGAQVGAGELGLGARARVERRKRNWLRQTDGLSGNEGSGAATRGLAPTSRRRTTLVEDGGARVARRRSQGGWF